MDNLLKSIAESLMYFNTVPHELAAIWLERKVMTDKGETVRIAADMLIRIDDDKISQTDNNFNKKILACYGTSYNQFRIKVQDIETGVISIINL